MTKLTTPEIRDFTSVGFEEPDVSNHSLKGYGSDVHTSVDEQELDPEVSIADTHEENVIHIVVELEVVIPDVAHELLDLRLLRPLVHLGGK